VSAIPLPRCASVVGTADTVGEHQRTNHVNDGQPSPLNADPTRAMKLVSAEAVAIRHPQQRASVDDGQCESTQLNDQGRWTHAE